MRELSWENAVEWGEIYCPMLKKMVMTYYAKGVPPYDTYTNPFVDEDGNVFFYKFDQDEGGWDDCAHALLEYCEGVRYELGS